jgi:eukaryotic-like serine/threonine-protein kinase
MVLSTGTRLGPYEILALIGAGGMGEVYKARDTRLDRIVAIKVSKEEFSERFEREARNVAALNHPNICTLHDVGPNYLVMEFVEGEMLSGPLPLDTALNYSRQIAEAIEAAHEKGIVHRDLKPANIKVTPEGAIKVLDFGLAKALDAELPAAPAQDSPTLSMAMTRAGMILGTAAYMSPEQAKGRPADRRADIWAFGVVLYEILVGKQVFTGETAAETLASVLKEPISLERLPKETPPALRNLLARCLERDIRQRLQAIGEARIILENPSSGTESPAQAEARPTKLPWIPWALSAVLFLALVAGAVWHFRPSPPPAITRFPIALGEGQVFNTTVLSDLAISPDGTQMAYAANNRLYLRSMANLEARPIPGTDGGGFLGNPVFSPDGKSLAFFDGFDAKIKRIAISGGAAVTICEVTNATTGMTWSEEGILFSSYGKGIMRVSPKGGQPEPLVVAKGNELLGEPQMLPGGQAVLFTLATGDNVSTAAWDKAQIVLQTLKSGGRKVVLEGGSDARYLPTGHLVYALNGVLFAVPFDLKRLETTGGAVGIVEGIARSVTGLAQFASSAGGSLIYIPGPVAGGGSGQDVLGMVDRKGDIEPRKVPPASYWFPRASKDGKRVTYQIDDGKDSSIWIYELSGATAPRRLTLPGTGSNRFPIWSSDNERVAFQSDREGDLGIWWQRADGSGAAERLTKPDKGVSDIPDSWSPDGQSFSFTQEKNGTSAVWTYSLRDKKAAVFAETPGSSFGRSVFSPDGHWVAYQLTAQPNSRIYVRPFPPTATAYIAPEDQDSHHPVWSSDGKELFYVSGPSQLASVSVTTKPNVSFGSPVRAPKSGFQTQVPSSVRTYDILPDGKHFIGVVPAGQTETGAATAQIQVVLNWFEDLKQRVVR